MTSLKKGDKAPEFSGVDQDGETINLSDYRGKKVILYFYPKDNTPGCTAEACNLNENYSELIKKGFEVIGVSPDSEQSHSRFISKYSLKFNLIADTDKSVLKSYGAWGLKKLYGKEYDGVLRTTFVIDENGIIESVFTKVDTKNHTQQILNEL